MNFWAGNVGTETSGSILSPANQNMLAAVKPTVGRISRYGVIPITADQDTPGPMTKSVADAAIMLGAMEGAAPDPNDPATKTCTPPPGRDYTKFLNAGGLKGARIGIPRAFFYDRITPPGEKEARGGLNDAQRKALTDMVLAAPLALSEFAMAAGDVVSAALVADCAIAPAASAACARSRSSR